MSEPLTRDGLHSELQKFAESVMKDQFSKILSHELASMKAELLNEIKGKSTSVKDEGAADNKPKAMVKKHTEAIETKIKATVVEVEEVGTAYPATTASGYTALPEDVPRTGRYSRRLHLDSGEEVHPVYSLVNQVVNSHSFENFEILLVLLNSIWMGYETEYEASTWSQEVPFSHQVIDWIFCIGFMGEVSLKLIDRGTEFFTGTEAKWNCFDLLVALSQLSESVVQLIHHSSEGGNMFVSALRLLRLIRIVRVARVAVVLKELRALITSISSSMLSLFWTLLLIALCIYMFGIGVTQVVNDAKVRNGKGPWEEQAEELLSMFDSLWTTMITLYMIISEGIHWKEVLGPLEKEVSIWMRPAMCLYVAFQLFAMMNVITAYFVDETVKQAAESTRVEIAGALWEMLEEDARRQGKTKEDLFITQADFARYKDHPKMHDYVELIGCNMSEFDEVFHLIDADGDETLSGEEFIHGASSLMGNASSSALARLRLSNRLLREKVEEHYASLVKLITKSQ